MTANIGKDIDEWLTSVDDPVGLLTKLFAHAPVALAVWTPSGVPVLTNQAFATLFRRQASDDDILAETTMLSAFRRAAAGETVHVPTFPCKTKEGPPVAVSSTFFPIVDGGVTRYVAATWKDETDAVVANERSRLAQQVAHVGTFEWDVQTHRKTWTSELDALYGLADGEFGSPDQTFDRLVHPDDRADVSRLVDEAFATFLPVEGEWRVRWPDGSLRWLFGRFQAIADENGKPRRLIGLNMDITDRKREEEARREAQAAVKQSEERLRITLNSIGDAVITTDASGSVNGINPVAEELTGWRLADARGRVLTDIFQIRNEETGELVESPVARVLREGKVIGLANHTVLVSRDGTERAIATSGAPIRDDEGTLRGVVLVFHDQTEERALQRALQRSEARFRRLADAGFIGIITADLGGNILEANEAFLRIVGYTSAEVSSGELRWSELTPREWSHLDQRAIEQLTTTGVAPPWEKEYIHEDGRRIPILVGAAMLDGGADECVAFILDLTERKKIEAALVQSEKRFRRLTESGTIGIVLSDATGSIREVNDAFLAIVGYTREDALAGRLHGRHLNTPERDKTDAAALVQIKERGVAQPWEKELLRKDGTRVSVLNGVVVLDEATQEHVAFVLDLTELKRAEAAVRESDAQRTAVMEAALDAIIVMDHEGRISDFNPAAERTFGYLRGEVLGRALADVLVPSRLREAHRDGLRRYLDTGAGNILGRRIEVPAVRRDGTEFPAEVAVVRIQSAGSPVFTGYIRDITERRQAAEAELLRRAKVATDEANAELEAFSYSVAHDLRAPLRGLSGFSAILLEDYSDRLDVKGRQYLERIAASAGRMSDIIDTLLSLARLTRTEVRRESVDLTRLASGVLEHLRGTEPGRLVDVEIEAGLIADGDPHLLRIVLDNLLGNAWKFTRRRRPGRIEVGVERTNGTVVYFVRDNGAGFDISHVEKLFAPFRRLHSSDEFEGTGIGLATVQRIVRRHGGRIWADGAEDRGATFRFTLSGESGDRGTPWATNG